MKNEEFSVYLKNTSIVGGYDVSAIGFRPLLHPTYGLRAHVGAPLQ